jgi:hypothetical protein
VLPLLQRLLHYLPNAEMTLDLEANEVEVKVLTSLASVAESTGILPQIVATSLIVRALYETFARTYAPGRSVIERVEEWSLLTNRFYPSHNGHPFTNIDHLLRTWVRLVS